MQFTRLELVCPKPPCLHAHPCYVYLVPPVARFPATFTFVVRSFTVLDGIGKSLDPRFDISEIAAPYARELLLEGSPQVGGMEGWASQQCG